MTTLTNSRTDGIAWWPTATVEKYDAATVRDIAAHLNISPEDVGYQALEHMKLTESLDPDSVVEVEGNAIVNGGKTRIAGLIIGSGSINPFSATYGVLGVGTSSTAVGGADAALLGTAYYKGLDTGPTNTSGSISAAANFGSGVAEHAWNEWCWAIATGSITPGTNFATVTGSGVMLNRKVASLGTKGAGTSWTFTTTVAVQGA